MSRQRTIDKLQQIERRWAQIRSELTGFDAFCVELATYLASVEALREDDDWSEAQIELKRLLEKYRVDEVLVGYESHTVRGSRSPVVALLEWVRHVAPIVAFPEVRAPQEVSIDVPFRVDVAAREAAPEAGAKPVSFPRSRRGPVDVEVELVLPLELASKGSTAALLRVPESGDSAGISFTVVPRSTGRHEIRVELRQRGVTLNVISAVVFVRGPVLAGEAPIATIETVRAASLLRPVAQPAGLTLRLTRAGGSGEDRFLQADLSGDPALLSSPACGTFPLGPDAQRRIAQLCLDMHELMPRTEGASREMRLERLGAKLGDALLPSSIQQALARVPEGTSLHIESDDAWAPWEAMAIEAREGTFFLGERFAVTRWLRQGNKRPEIGSRRATLVALRRSNLDVAAERAVLAKIARGPVPELERLLEVQTCLSRGDSLGFLHFACHGSTDPDVAAGAKLLLEGAALLTDDVPRLRDGVPDGPLASSCVFINACEAGIPERSLTGHGSWAEAFVAAGVTAVIVPAWSVKDRIASAFVTPFYEALERGETVGASARAARLAVRKAGEPDRLAYAVFAAPWARLVPET